ncbi:type II/IV secretion system protein [Candidatus Peregrinibacteria bacterium]|nr:type II/IV secretion system protein [Candidatus Peregrinibacteria bacterium]
MDNPTNQQVANPPLAVCPQPVAQPPAQTSPQPAAQPASETKPVPQQPPDDKLKQLQEAILAANIPQMVMMAISYALEIRASDIHIEPLENRVRIRYRVDGVLRHIVEYPTNLHPAVVSRIKIMSNLKIDEQRIPQDGRADVTTKEGRAMDLRVSTLPTVNSEKIVMRIQDKSKKIPDLPELGIAGVSLKNLEAALQSPNGIIITTGPTGSGKTTTLYSCLMRLNKTEVNILTIEDPVEIQMDGLNQSQVHHDINYNFETGMRAALRQDPNIIMVGEIRDKETADTAIEASLTGHLVLSTLHTNSAVESITRIVNMGIQPYLLTSTLELIIAQRLVRKMCQKCKKPVETSPEMIEIIKKAMEKLYVKGEIDPELLKNMQFFESPGCAECNNIGYKGRVGLYEVLRINNEIRKLILSGATTMDIQEAAQKNGMVTLEQGGIINALQGMTTIEEVYRVSRKSE